MKDLKGLSWQAGIRFGVIFLIVDAGLILALALVTKLCGVDDTIRALLCAVFGAVLGGVLPTRLRRALIDEPKRR